MVDMSLNQTKLIKIHLSLHRNKKQTNTTGPHYATIVTVRNKFDTL